MESRLSVSSISPRLRDTPEVPCANCGDATIAAFCPGCGQRKREIRVSTRRILMDALDDQFSLNSALPRTLVALLFRPGHLTREYLDGRVARYIAPFRLYLFSSLLFFLLLSLTAGGEWAASRLDGAEVGFAPAQPEAAGATTPDGAMTEGVTTTPTVQAGEDWMADVSISTPIERLNALIRERKAELGKMDRRTAVRQLYEGFLEQLPKMVFLLLPIFAVLLKLAYVRRKRFYVEHFVFAMHVHAFAFLLFALPLVAPGDVEVMPLLVLWLFLYIYLAMRKVYSQGYLKTGVKYAAVGMGYALLLSFALAATAIVALLFS